MENEFYTIFEFAKKLRVHHNTVRRAIKSGRIHAFRLNDNQNSPWRIPGSENNHLAFMDMQKIVNDLIDKKKG